MKLKNMILLFICSCCLIFLCGNSFSEENVSISKTHSIEDKSNEEQINTIYEVIENTVEEEKTYLGEFKLTAYCPCAKCCGKANNKCANGEYPKEGITIAADLTKLPIGTKVHIDGIGERIVMDSGSAIKGNKIDVFINSHQECLEFGVKRDVKVWIIKESE